MTLNKRPRSALPIAPQAKPARRGLAILHDARPEDQRWRPTYAVWEITLACDLSCRHCGSRAGKARPDELTTAEALDVVEQLAALGTKEVTLIGGEAYLRDDWTRIARAVADKGMRCTMTTGGRQLTRERAQQAKDAGIAAVSVSVDGFEELHDRLRGVKGSFAAACAALENLAAVGLRATANTQITRPGLPHIEALGHHLVTLGIRAWQVQITVAMGRAVDEPELLLEPYHMLEVLPLLARMKPVLEERGVLLWPGNNIGYFGPHEETLRGHIPRGYMWSCGAGRSTLGIEANGDVKGCPSLPSADYVGGNLRDHSLKTIWEQTAPLRFTRDRTVADLWGYCRSCYYADTCRAGCSWTATVLFGKPGNNPFCHHRALELLRQSKRERIVRIAAAPNEPFDQGRWELLEEEWPADQLERARRLAVGGQGSL